VKGDGRRCSDQSGSDTPGRRAQVFLRGAGRRSGRSPREPGSRMDDDRRRV